MFALSSRLEADKSALHSSGPVNSPLHAVRDLVLPDDFQRRTLGVHRQKSGLLFKKGELPVFSTLLICFLLRSLSRSHGLEAEAC